MAVCAVCDKIYDKKTYKEYKLSNNLVTRMNFRLHSKHFQLHEDILSYYDVSETFQLLKNVLLSHNSTPKSNIYRKTLDIKTFCYNILVKVTSDQIKRPKFSIAKGLCIGALPFSLMEMNMTEKILTSLPFLKTLLF